MFSRIADLIRIVREVGRWQLEFLLNHLYILLGPGFLVLKFFYSLINEAMQRLYDALDSIDVEFMSNVEGEYASVMDLMEVVNYMVPILELFLVIQGLIALWSVALTIRTVKGIKQTVAF